MENKTPIVHRKRRGGGRKREQFLAVRLSIRSFFKLRPQCRLWYALSCLVIERRKLNNLKLRDVIFIFINFLFTVCNSTSESESRAKLKLSFVI